MQDNVEEEDFLLEVSHNELQELLNSRESNSFQHLGNIYYSIQERVNYE